MDESLPGRQNLCCHGWPAYDISHSSESIEPAMERRIYSAATSMTTLYNAVDLSTSNNTLSAQQNATAPIHGSNEQDIDIPFKAGELLWYLGQNGILHPVVLHVKRSYQSGSVTVSLLEKGYERTQVRISRLRPFSAHFQPHPKSCIVTRVLGSFSCWKLIEKTKIKVSYEGCFFGAECIEVGTLVRIRQSKPNVLDPLVVMRVEAISTGTGKWYDTIYFECSLHLPVRNADFSDAASRGCLPTLPRGHKELQQPVPGKQLENMKGERIDIPQDLVLGRYYTDEERSRMSKDYYTDAERRMSEDEDGIELNYLVERPERMRRTANRNEAFGGEFDLHIDNGEFLDASMDEH